MLSRVRKIAGKIDKAAHHLQSSGCEGTVSAATDVLHALLGTQELSQIKDISETITWNQLEIYNWK